MVLVNEEMVERYPAFMNNSCVRKEEKKERAVKQDCIPAVIREWVERCVGGYVVFSFSFSSSEQLALFFSQFFFTIVIIIIRQVLSLIF